MILGYIETLRKNCERKKWIDGVTKYYDESKGLEYSLTLLKKLKQNKLNLAAWTEFNE